MDFTDHRSLACDLVEVGGKSVKIEAEKTSTADLAGDVRAAAEAAGLLDIAVVRETDEAGKGRGKNVIRLTGRPDPKSRYTVESIDVTRTRSKRPSSVRLMACESSLTVISAALWPVPGRPAGPSRGSESMSVMMNYSMVSQAP